MRTVRVSSANAPLVQVLAAAAVSAVIWTASALSAQDKLHPGEFVAFVTAMSMLFEPIRRLTNINAVIQRGLAGAQSIFRVARHPARPDTSTSSRTAPRPLARCASTGCASAIPPGRLGHRRLQPRIAPGETVAWSARRTAARAPW